MDKRTVYHRIIDEDIPYARKPGLRSDTAGKKFRSVSEFPRRAARFRENGDGGRGLVFKGDEGEPVGLTVWLIQRW